MDLEPSIEQVGTDPRYQWDYPLQQPARASRKLRCVWYVALPLTTAHRGSHSGGGALIQGSGEQSRYLNEGTVYPHASLVEMITYHARCFPEVRWRYIDLTHSNWEDVKLLLHEERPDVIALTTYSATALWAYVVAAEAKLVNPRTVVVLGNDHAGILYREILTGHYGQKIVDFVSTGNNGPFTMMGLLYALQEQSDLERVPSIAYRHGGSVINQAAPTYPLRLRILPDYRLIESELERSYDRASHAAGGPPSGRAPRSPRPCRPAAVRGRRPRSPRSCRRPGDRSSPPIPPRLAAEVPGRTPPA